MNDCSFMNLYMYNMLSLFHSGKANLKCDTNCVYNLTSRDIRSDGFSKVGMNVREVMAETWFRIDKMSILNECIPLQSVARWFFSWNMKRKMFLYCIRALSFFRKVMNSTVYVNNVFL